MLQSALQYIPYTTYHVMAAAAATVASKSNRQVTRATGYLSGMLQHPYTNAAIEKSSLKPSMHSRPCPVYLPNHRLSLGRVLFSKKRPPTPHRQWLIWVIHYARAQFLSVRWTCRMSNFSAFILLRVPFPSSLPSCGTGGRQSC